MAEGGATRKVINCCLGKASVKIEGISTMTPISAIFQNDSEGRRSSPLGFQPAAGFQKAIFKHKFLSYFRTYVNLDTDRIPFAPEESRAAAFQAPSRPNNMSLQPLHK